MGPAAQAAPASLSKPPLQAGRWWQAIVLLILVAWLYSSILLRLANQWSHDPNFSHGFFVPAFSLFVLWQERSRLSAVHPKPSWWGLAIVLAALCILILGNLGAELFLSRASLLLLIAGLVVFFQGWHYFRAMLFPWAFLLLMIPIPSIIFNQFTFPL